MATIAATTQGFATTMATSERGIGAQLQVLLMFLMRLDPSLSSEKLIQEIVEGL
jgi:hypothetical protein